MNIITLCDCQTMSACVDNSQLTWGSAHLGRYEAQMQYGSIGWSVGAALGYQLGAAPKGNRLCLFMGDGCFQIGAQVGACAAQAGAEDLSRSHN